MSERRLSAVLTRRFHRLARTTLAGYAVLMVVSFAIASETVLERSLERSADVLQTLVGAYGDSAGGPGGVAPAALAEQLVGMGGRVLITRTAVTAGGQPEVYYLSPGMPARRLEGLPASASPDDVRQAMLAAIAERARWRYRVLHRATGAFDIYIVASREPSLLALGALALVAAGLLPLAALLHARGARRTVDDALRPLARVAAGTRAIGPADLGKRLASPTGQAEVTDLAEAINRMLERVDRGHRALESFTADASHELRTPLTHLRAQLQWARMKGRTGGEVRDALAAMERELERTTRMVDDLLLIARGENQQLPLERAPFDLRAVAREVKEIAEAMAVGGSRALDVELDAPEPVWATGDADRTRQILLNLASNAVRYTPAGTVCISVAREGDRALVSIQDTGPGIAPEHLERVFDRFYRIDPSRTRASGGTGLGLAIARLLARLQDGTITVESTPGEGSSFTLWLLAAGTPISPD